MGRSNRSRKRRDEMNRIKRERYAKKELARLKKTLGIIDEKGLLDEIKDSAIVLTAKDIKNQKKEEELAEIELNEENDKGELVEVVNEKTGKVQKFNTKTMRDEDGNYPKWYKKKNTEKRIRKLNYSRKMNFKQQWTTSNVPL